MSKIKADGVVCRYNPRGNNTCIGDPNAPVQGIAYFYGMPAERLSQVCEEVGAGDAIIRARDWLLERHLGEYSAVMITRILDIEHVIKYFDSASEPSGLLKVTLMSLPTPGFPS